MRFVLVCNTHILLSKIQRSKFRAVELRAEHNTGVEFIIVSPSRERIYWRRDFQYGPFLIEASVGQSPNLVGYESFPPADGSFFVTSRDGRFLVAGVLDGVSGTGHTLAGDSARLVSEVLTISRPKIEEALALVPDSSEPSLLVAAILESLRTRSLVTVQGAINGNIVVVDNELLTVEVVQLGLNEHTPGLVIVRPDNIPLDIERLPFVAPKEMYCPAMSQVKDAIGVYRVTTIQDLTLNAEKFYLVVHSDGFGYKTELLEWIDSGAAPTRSADDRAVVAIRYVRE